MRLTRRVFLPVVGIVLICVAVAAVLRGGHGAAGAGAGGVLTLLFLASSPGLLNPVARRSPAASLPVALAFFGVKAGAAVLLLAAILDPSGVGRHLHTGSLAAAMVVTALGWIALHLWALTQARTPTYDLGDTT